MTVNQNPFGLLPVPWYSSALKQIEEVTMRSNAAKKPAMQQQPASAPKAKIKLVQKYETDQYDELVGIDYEAFLLQYGVRSDFA